jgi:hypothetical protein
MPLLSAFCPDDREFGMTDCGEFSILNAGKYCVYGKHVAESLSRLNFIKQHPHGILGPYKFPLRFKMRGLAWAEMQE